MQNKEMIMIKGFLFTLTFLLLSCAQQATNLNSAIEKRPFKISNKDISLSGEVHHVPQSTKIILFLHDVGHYDRWQSIPADLSSTGVESSFFFPIGEMLNQEGYSTAYFDKRCFNTEDEKILQTCTFENSKSDAETVLRYLQNLKHYKEIILLGHGEGAVLASEISIKEAKNPLISKIILIGTLGTNYKESLHEQMTIGMVRNIFVEADRNKDGKIEKEEIPPHLQQTIPLEKIDIEKKGYITQGDYLRLLEKQFKKLISFVEQDNQNSIIMRKPTLWYKEFIQRPSLIDLAKDFSKPVVLIHGKNDEQNNFNTNALTLSTRLRFYRKKVELIGLKNLGHALSEQRNSLPTFGPVSQEGLKAIKQSLK